MRHSTSAKRWLFIFLCAFFGAVFIATSHRARIRLSNIDHGDTLAEVMEGIREEDFEVTAVFTAEGKKLYEYTNREDVSVEISDAHVDLLRRHSGLIFLHNHPVWDSASFSSLDLEMLASYEASCGIVVSKAETYVILANDRWPPSNEIGQFVRDRPELTETIWFQSSSGAMKDMPAITHRLMRLVAAEYNLSYYGVDNSNISSAEIATAILGP